MLVWVTFCVVKKNWGKHKNKDSYTVQCGVEGIGACLCEDTDCLCGCVCVCVRQMVDGPARDSTGWHAEKDCTS